jgi:hypothetical protein
MGVFWWGSDGSRALLSAYIEANAAGAEQNVKSLLAQFKKAGGRNGQAEAEH